MELLWGTTRPHFDFSHATDRIPTLSRLSPASAGQTVCHLNGVGLGARAGTHARNAHQDEVYLAAIVGSPRFVTPAMAAQARDQGNAAALIALYRAHGKSALQHLHGAFALAIIDTLQRSIFFAVDRAGTQPLCFSHDSEGLTLGSTADLVLADAAVQRNLDTQALFNYLFFHTVPSPGTIYQAIGKLQPGECAWFMGGQLTREFYWHMPYADHNPASYSDLAHAFRDCLSKAVTRSTDSSAVGAFLSGGTDSSTIAGLLTQTQGRPADTFSIGFQAEGFDETEYARMAARHFGTHPHEYYLTPEDVANAIPLIAAAYDEPFGNASAVPTYYCAKLAQTAGMTTLLAGDGGDELFGGNARYAKQKVFELYRSLPAFLRTGLIEPLVQRAPVLHNTKLFGKARSYIAQANTPLPDRLESYNFMARMALDTILEPAFLHCIDNHAPIDLMREVYMRTDSQSIINRMMHLDLKLILADNDLRKVSRMCALAGVDVHYPMLDDEVMAFSARLKPDYKVKGQQLRWFFKQALHDFLPREILTKSKHGFGLPFGLWMQQHAPLQQLAYDSLNAFKQRGYVKPGYIDYLIEQHRSGHASYYGVMIWVLMMLEQWLQQHPHTQ